MTKPLDETWEAKYGACDPDDRGSIEIWHVRFPDEHAVYLYDDEDRARLASAAPDMVRVLLAVEWEGGDSFAFCPSCGGLRDGLSGEPPGHRADRDLDAALRKAGVRG
jgi:hypothetical protein